MNKRTNCWLRSVGDLFFAEQTLLSCNSKNSAWDLEVTSDYNITLLFLLLLYFWIWTTEYFFNEKGIFEGLKKSSSREKS